MKATSWEEVKGKINAWLAVYGGKWNATNDDIEEYNHMQRCVNLFIEAIESGQELKIVDGEVDAEDNYHGC